MRCNGVKNTTRDFVFENFSKTNHWMELCDATTLSNLESPCDEITILLFVNVIAH